ncbi:diaminopimelate epimerase [Paenibacillus cymbidii]|uniref:diaminopimelate epimerase n=1 Tax=Paenibacillus cymbidii TaxID=1639034 RepID=UPI001080E8D7|nr:diaminopimelate epimerase [Paenibacillus cymbidii]
MKFTKMHGLGNDFIVIYGLQELPADAAQLAVKLCDRHFGIGADGLVYILPSAKAQFRMRIVNNDGSEAEQCGNAIRCVAKYLYDRSLASGSELTVETIGAGVQRVVVTDDGSGKAASIKVDMGEPVLQGMQVPTTIDEALVRDYPVTVDGREFRFTAVSMGNPHCVIYVDDATAVDLYEWGPKLEHHPLFPRRINVEFVHVESRGHAIMRVWERGAGPTLACGTGACAVLVSSVLNGLTDRCATVTLTGGDLQIEWSEADNRVYMTGPAEEVYTGETAL